MTTHRPAPPRPDPSPGTSIAVPRRFHPCVKCTAHRTDGQPCRNWACRGQQVCGSHGGRSPQAKAAAWRRLEAAAAEAIITRALSEDAMVTQQRAASARRVLGLPSEAERMARTWARHLADMARLDALEAELTGAVRRPVQGELSITARPRRGSALVFPGGRDHGSEGNHG
jgi:hypothetical protein